MWQPKWYQWVVIWAALVLARHAARLHDDESVALILMLGGLLVWYLPACAARS